MSLLLTRAARAGQGHGNEFLACKNRSKSGPVASKCQRAVGQSNGKEMPESRCLDTPIYVQSILEKTESGQAKHLYPPFVLALKSQPYLGYSGFGNSYASTSSHIAQPVCITVEDDAPALPNRDQFYRFF